MSSTLKVDLSIHYIFVPVFMVSTLMREATWDKWYLVPGRDLGSFGIIVRGSKFGVEAKLKGHVLFGLYVCFSFRL